MAQTFFWANGPFYAILGVLFILRYALQGLGNTKAPTMAGFAEMISRSIGAFVFVIWFGFFGASLSNPLAWVASVLCLLPAWNKYRREIMDKLEKD